MKVEFTTEESWTMLNYVVDQLAALEMADADRARLRRWRSREMAVATPAMQRLAEKLNSEIQRTHDRKEVSPIVKPDWL